MGETTKIVRGDDYVLVNATLAQVNGDVRRLMNSMLGLREHLPRDEWPEQTRLLWDAVRDHVKAQMEDVEKLP